MDRPESRKILDDISEEVAASIYGSRSQTCVYFWILLTMEQDLLTLQRGGI